MVLSSKCRESVICGVTVQRGVNGRVGRTALCFGGQQQSDSILDNAICKAYGIGVSMNDEYLRNLYYSERNAVSIEKLSHGVLHVLQKQGLCFLF